MVTRSSALPAISAYPVTTDTVGTGRRQLLEMRRAREANAPQRNASGIDEYAVQEQLSRVLGSAFFRNSDRYTRLLQYVVDTALHSDSALLKERLIGVHVFGRDPSYDTVKDNVVRIAAAEVRGRLVRYYAIPEHRRELRIALYPGSYVPQFVSADLTQQPPVSVETEENSALNKFWGPLLQSLEPILIVLGPSQESERRGAVRTKTEGGHAYRNLSEQITLSDALTLSRMVSYLESKGKEYRVEMQGFVRFRDLRNGPAILLGGLNNQWTLSFAEHLRFAFKTKQGSAKTWIRDKDLPSRQLWIHDSSIPLPAITEDHAIVARLLESATGQPIMIAGGHSAYGTAAAGEFVTNRAYLESFTAGDTHDWGSSNLELVIATSVVRGVSGPPRINAAYAW